jgi:diguanylate cyclase (GGDEF)-like protein
MANWSIGFWLFLLLGLRALLHLLDVPGAHDSFGAIVICLVLFLAWRQLGVHRHLRPFFWGVALYLAGTLLDWADGLLGGLGTWGMFADVGDDLLLSVGFFLMALAFIRVMLERDRLEAKLYAQAYRDELTGLGNRRALFEQLESLLQSGSGTLLYVDVDHFKSVNDLHGHDVGDLVLKACGQALKAAEGGQAFRLGGDEFVLLLGSMEPSVVGSQISALHGGVRSLSEQYGIALSIGVTRFSPGSVPDPDSALKQADQQMYEAKRQNRRRPR